MKYLYLNECDIGRLIFPFIECGVFVGASDLVGSFWTGDLYYYSNPIDVTCLEHYAAKLFFECGICDGKFLSNSGRVILRLLVFHYYLHDHLT